MLERSVNAASWSSTYLHRLPTYVLGMTSTTLETCLAIPPFPAHSLINWLFLFIGVFIVRSVWVLVINGRNHLLSPNLHLKRDTKKPILVITGALHYNGTDCFSMSVRLPNFAEYPFIGFAYEVAASYMYSLYPWLRLCQCKVGMFLSIFKVAKIPWNNINHCVMYLLSHCYRYWRNHVRVCPRFIMCIVLICGSTLFILVGIIALLSSPSHTIY